MVQKMSAKEWPGMFEEWKQEFNVLPPDDAR
jgi:hypothetical protein